MKPVAVEPERPVRGRPSLRGGFTLIELMAVVVIIAFIMAMLLPAISRSKAKAQGILCLNNKKQIQIAWGMYAEDHLDWLPGVVGGSFPGPGKWVSGWLDFSSSPDNTNTSYLSEARFAQLGPYIKAALPYRCPADASSVVINSKNRPRVRSLSMNCWMNYVGSSAIGQDAYTIFRKTTQINDPPPSRAWVFIDEREDSINDGLFQVDLKNRGKLARIVDYPASYHDTGAGIVFADGHSEVHRWTDRRTYPVLTTTQLIQYNVPSPDNADVAWLQQRSSSPKPLEQW